MSEFPMDPNTSPTLRSRRRRFAPLAVVAGVAATAALALSMTGTLSAFTAQITNSANSVTDGTLVITETQVGGAGTVCNSTDGTGNSVANNAYTCTTINKYGGSTLVPGASSTNTVTIANTGTTSAASATLAPLACVQTGSVTGSAADVCSQLLLTVTKTPAGGTASTIVNNVKLDTFFANNKTGGTPGPLAFGPLATGASNAVSFTFTVTLPAGLGNTYQGLTATQPLVWLFSAGS